MGRVTKEARAESLERLRGAFKPGSTVITVLRSVARSGMSRRVSVFCNDYSGREIDSATFDTARAMGWRLFFGFRWEMGVSGCGMDMMLHTADCLAGTLCMKLIQHPRRDGDPYFDASGTPLLYWRDL